MGPMMQTMAESLRFTSFVMKVATGDIKAEDAVRRARGSEGASISWIVGHLTGYRCQIMKVLGHEFPNPLGETIGDHATDGAGYPPLTEIVAAFARVSEELEKVIANVDDRVLDAPVDPGSPHREKKVLQVLSFYVWHEAYHMGQLGTLRAQFGYRQTSDVAQEAAKATA